MATDWLQPFVDEEVALIARHEAAQPAADVGGVFRRAASADFLRGGNDFFLELVVLHAFQVLEAQLDDVAFLGRGIKFVVGFVVGLERGAGGLQAFRLDG